MDTFENVLGQFENSEVIPFFWNFSTSRPSRVQWTKKFQWNHLKTCLDTLRNVFGHFWNFKLFSIFFSNFSKIRPFRVHWSIILTKKKLPQSMFKTCLNFLGNVFGHFEKKWKFFHFSGVFPCFDPPGCTGQNIFRKIPQNKFKTCLETFKNVLDNFRNSNFFDSFFEFLISRLHWSRKVRKKSPQKKFGHFWKRFSGFWKFFFHFLKLFDFFTLQGVLGEFFYLKKFSKHVENKFEHFWERIWAFWKLKVFQFFEVFPSLDIPGCTGQFFPRKLPQNKFKICLDTFRTVFGHFWSFKFLSIFFSNFSKFRPSRVHWSIF